MSDNLELLAADPDEVARRVLDGLGKLSRAEASELVYSPLGGQSYYRDLIARSLGRGTPTGEQRLQRHAEQMDRVRAAREEDSWRRAGTAGMEFRVTPDRTDGYGGYFSPPAWLNQLFATANRPGRVLSGLAPRFPLPPGVSQVDVPVVNTGTVVQPTEDDYPVPDQDITDTSTSSYVAALGGQADVALQLLEQSPAGAHLDWAIFMDLSEAYDYDLETQMLVGNGSAGQIQGVINVSGVISVGYTSGSPTGSAMWVPLSKVPAQVSDARLRPPECWMMRTARWAWLQGQEDTATRPFGLSTRFFLGNDDATPDPISGMMGWPVFLNDAIPATLGGTGGVVVGAGTQDAILCLRPRDLILLEGEPQTIVAREPLSGSLGVRLRMHCNAAALTGRRPSGIGVLQGTGLTVQTGY